MTGGKDVDREVPNPFPRVPICPSLDDEYLLPGTLGLRTVFTGQDGKKEIVYEETPHGLLLTLSLPISFRVGNEDLE